MIYGTLQRKPTQSALPKLQAYYQSGGLTSTFPAKGHGCWTNDRVFLAQQHPGSLPTALGSNAPEVHPQAGCVITMWGRLDNRDELMVKLTPSSPQQTDAALVLEAWLRWRRDAVLHLIGDFVFAIYAPHSQCLFCARDHLGVRPFYYQLTDQHLVFGSSLLVLQDSGCCDLSVEQQWLAEALMGLSMSFNKTPYQQIFKLPPGHSLYVDSQSSELQQYYRMSAESRLQLKDSREYVEAYQDRLEEAIRCRLVQDDPLRPLGSELSGGIDSSTITVFAADMLPQAAEQLHGFSFASCEQEPEYIHAVSQAIPMAATHVMARKSAINMDRRRTHSIIGYPEEHTNGSAHATIYRLAQQLDIRVLLSGFGGDEFVTTYGSLTLRELYNQKNYRRLLDYQEGDSAILRFCKMVKFIQRQWRGEQKRKINPRFLPGCQMSWDNRLLQDRWLQRYPLKEQLFAQARYDAGYSSLNEFTIDGRWQPFVSTRMESCSLMAAAQQVEYRWPLLDVRLIDLFLSIPCTEKYYRGTSRWLHKRAINGRVPDKVTWKNGKDMGPPISLGDSPVADINLVDPLHPMLDELVDKKRLEAVMAKGAHSVPRDVNYYFKTKGLRMLATLDQWLKGEY